MNVWCRFYDAFNQFRHKKSYSLCVVEELHMDVCIEILGSTTIKFNDPILRFWPMCFHSLSLLLFIHIFMYIFIFNSHWIDGAFFVMPINSIFILFLCLALGEITYDNKMKNHQKPSCAGQKRIIQNDVDHFFFIFHFFCCVSAFYLRGGRSVGIISSVESIKTFVRWCWIL